MISTPISMLFSDQPFVIDITSRVNCDPDHTDRKKFLNLLFKNLMCMRYIKVSNSKWKNKHSKRYMFWINPIDPIMVQETIRDDFEFLFENKKWLITNIGTMQYKDHDRQPNPTHTIIAFTVNNKLLDIMIMERLIRLTNRMDTLSLHHRLATESCG